MNMQQLLFSICAFALVPWMSSMAVDTGVPVDEMFRTCHKEYQPCFAHEDCYDPSCHYKSSCLPITSTHSLCIGDSVIPPSDELFSGKRETQKRSLSAQDDFDSKSQTEVSPRSDCREFNPCIKHDDCYDPSCPYPSSCYTGLGFGSVCLSDNIIPPSFPAVPDEKKNRSVQTVQQNTLHPKAVTNNAWAVFSKKFRNKRNLRDRIIKK